MTYVSCAFDVKNSVCNNKLMTNMASPLIKHTAVNANAPAHGLTSFFICLVLFIKSILFRDLAVFTAEVMVIQVSCSGRANDVTLVGK